MSKYRIEAVVSNNRITYHVKKWKTFLWWSYWGGDLGIFHSAFHSRENANAYVKKLNPDEPVVCIMKGE
jgi:hypothetical protein